jgi:hypothetical protein
LVIRSVVSRNAPRRASDGVFVWMAMGPTKGGSGLSLGEGTARRDRGRPGGGPAGPCAGPTGEHPSDLQASHGRLREALDRVEGRRGSVPVGRRGSPKRDLGRGGWANAAARPAPGRRNSVVGYGVTWTGRTVSIFQAAWRQTVPRNQHAKPRSGRSGLKPTSQARRRARTLRPSSAALRAGRFPVPPGVIPSLVPDLGGQRDRGRDRGPPGLLRAEDGERRC